MNIKAFVNDIWYTASDCFTDDDTYDFALEIVETELKKIKLDRKHLSFEDGILAHLVHKINDKISGIVYHHGNEEYYGPSSVKKAKRELTAAVKWAQVLAHKEIKNNLELLKKSIEAKKKSDQIYDALQSINHPVWQVKHVKKLKSKKVFIPIKDLEKVMDLLREYNSALDKLFGIE